MRIRFCFLFAKRTGRLLIALQQLTPATIFFIIKANATPTVMPAKIQYAKFGFIKILCTLTIVFIYQQCNNSAYSDAQAEPCTKVIERVTKYKA
jgi:hypothetical protein